MLVPVVSAVSVSPSRKWPVIDTVAPDSVVLANPSRPAIHRAPQRRRLRSRWRCRPSPVIDGGSALMPRVSEPTLLLPLVVLLSFTCQEIVRLLSVPPLVGSPALLKKVIDCSAAA